MDDGAFARVAAHAAELITLIAAALLVLVKGGSWCWRKTTAVYDFSRRQFTLHRDLDAQREESRKRGEAILRELRAHGDRHADDMARIEGRIEQLSTGVMIADEVRGAGEFRTDPDGRCHFLSPGYCRIVGRGESELMGAGWENTIAIDSRGVAIDDWYAAVKARNGFEATYAVVRPSGARVEVYCAARPVYAKGALLGYVGRIYDVAALNRGAPV